MKGELLFNIDLDSRSMQLSSANHSLANTIHFLASTLAPVLCSCGFRSIRWKIDDKHTICIRKLLASRFDFTAYFVR